jgi:hypothetical protein
VHAKHEHLLVDFSVGDLLSFSKIAGPVACSSFASDGGVCFAGLHGSSTFTFTGSEAIKDAIE